MKSQMIFLVYLQLFLYYKVRKNFYSKMKRTQAALQQVKLVKCICYDRISDTKIAQYTQNLREVIKQDN